MSRKYNKKGKSAPEKGTDTAFNTVPESGFNKEASKGKGNKQSKKGSNPKFKEGKGPTGKGRNPIELWNKHPELTEAAGNLSYAQALGQPIDWDSAGGIITNAIGSTTYAGLPGIARLGLSLTYGTAQEKGSALNIAARNIYTFVRHMNSGHTNYDAANLMQYLIAVDQCYAMYSWLVRAYGTLLNYKVLNRYTPDDLLLAQHLDPSTFRGNMAQFRFALDAWSVRLQSFLVPSTIGVFKRHYDMFSNYYLDSENLQIAQVYMFTPDELFYWDDAATAVEEHFKVAVDLRPTWEITSVDASHVGTLGTGPNDAGLLTYTQVVNIMENMLQSIAVTEDFNIMSGDILKAYGIGSTWTVPMLSAAYIAEPVFNWEMLVQIHNAHICESVKFVFKSGVTDATLEAWINELNDRSYRPTEIVDPLTQISYLKMDCFSAGSHSCWLNGASALDVPFTNPTPQDNLEATRLKALAGSEFAVTSRLLRSSSGVSMSKLRSFGTEVVTSFEICSRLFSHLSTHGDYSYASLSTSNVKQFINSGTNQLEHTIPFTLFPIFYRVAAYSSWTFGAAGTIDDLTFDANDPTTGTELLQVQGNTASPMLVGELDHTTLVAGYVVDNLHTVAILSAFDIPAAAYKG